jgi:hypothetical protein
MTSTKKFKLDVNDKTPLRLIGILSDENDLKLSWLLNKAIPLNLARDEDLNWLSKKLPNSQTFPIYSDQDSKYGPIRLLKNKTLEGLWIKGYKQVDYLFVIMMEAGHQDYDTIINKIQKISGIRGAYILDPKPIQAWIE